MHSWPGPSENTSSAPPWQAQQTAALEDLAKAVLHDHKHLMVWGHGQPSALQAGQALQAYWEAMALGITITHFSGHQPLTWLGHINQLVAQQGLNQVMQQPASPSTPGEIGFIDHADQLQAKDFMLLQDVTRHMPGLGLRWVLLFHEAPDSPGSATPHLAGLENQASTWLSWHMPDPLTPDQAPTPLTADPQEQRQHPYSVAAPPQRSGLATIALWSVGLVLLMALLAWFFSTQSTDLLARPATTPATTSAAIPTATSASTSASISASTASEPTPLQDSQAASEGPGAPQAQASAPATPASASPASAAAPPEAAQALLGSTEVPDIALRGARWLAQLSPEHFVLEHGRFDTAQQAQNLIRGRSELSNARVIMVRASGTNALGFQVITGPFRSEDRALNYKIREKLPPQVQVRSVSSVLQEAVTARKKPR